MCGFVKRVDDSPVVQALMYSVGLEDSVLSGGQFYPRQQVFGMIIKRHRVQIVNPIWWYALKKTEVGLEWNPAYTTFNARDLSRNLWQQPIRQRRGVFLANAIGESNVVNGKKQQYLMTAEKGLILGALYNVYQWNKEEVFSMAIITRPPIDGFDQYHPQSMPLFLPNDRQFLQTWLDPDITEHAVIDELLRRPVLTSDLTVTRVKSYKHEEPLGEPEYLKAA